MKIKSPFRSQVKSIVKFILTIALSVSFSARAQAQASAVANTASTLMSATIPVVVLVGTTSKPPCVTGNMLACALIGASVAQVVLSLAGSRKAKASANALASGAGATSTADGISEASPIILGTSAAAIAATNREVAALNAEGLGSLASDYRSMRDAASASGISVSADGSTVKLPNGKSVSTGALGSADALRKSGFSESDISGLQSAMDDAAKKADAYKSKVASLTNDQGGGGSGSGSGSGDEALGGSRGRDSDYARRAAAGNAKDKGVAGMSKKLGNDNIGVSGDDIFEMITRRYKARDQVDAFLKN